MKEFINLTSVDTFGKETVVSVNINTINSIEPTKGLENRNTLIYLNNRVLHVKETYGDIMNLMDKQMVS